MIDRTHNVLTCVHLNFYYYELDYPTESSPLDWTDDRFKHIMKLKQEALDIARSKWADFTLVTNILSIFTILIIKELSFFIDD